MRPAPRLFLAPDALVAGTVRFPPDQAHYLRDVLRLRPGDRVTALDGSGRALTVELAECDRQAVAGQIVAEERPATEPPVCVVVAQAIGKGDRTEQALQHATEVGAAGFVVFAAARSVVRLSGEAEVARRLARWRRVVQEAAEQSGRVLLPEVAWAPTLADCLARPDLPSLRLLLHPDGAEPLAAWLSPATEALLVAVGPEGGFDPAEAALAPAVTLGPRILRTETAAPVAVGTILARLCPGR